MKKLLLYLMALLAFGAVPGSSFATQYLIVPTEENNWDVTVNEEGEFSGNNATLTGVKIGAGKFALGVYDDANGRISWYKLNTTSQELEEGRNHTFLYVAEDVYSPTGAGMQIQQNAVMNVADATAGDVFEIAFSLRNKRVSASADYSHHKAGYKGAGTDNGTSHTVALDFSSDTMFELNPGSNDYFNVWFESPDGSTKTVFGDGSGLNAGLTASDSAEAFSYEGGKLTATTDIDNASKITGLEPNTYYRVYVNYRDKMLTITKIPVQLYFRGQTASGWNSFSSDSTRRFQTQPDPESPDGSGLLYVIDRQVTNNDYFAINAGPNLGANDREFQYSLQALNNKNLGSGDFGQWLNLYKVTGANTAIHYTGTSDKLRVMIKLDAENKPVQIWFEKSPGYIEDTNYGSYKFETLYGNGSSHVTSNIYFDETKSNWIAEDKGNMSSDTSSAVIYDGLRLGYDPFCLKTYSPDGVVRYWGLESDNGGLIPGSTYTFKSFDNQEDAQKFTRIKESSEGLVNSRYDIVWNFNTKEATISLNEEWTNAPNQMYLYRLSDKDIENNIDKGNMLSYVKAAIANNSPNVFVLDRVSDGLYECNFYADDTEDLPLGTRFCIVGRTGNVYNIHTDDGSSFSFGNDWNDGDNSYRLLLTYSDTQQPATINTNRIANNDVSVRVRANFTSGDEFQNDYVITFTEQEPTPVKFLMYTEYNEGSAVDITKEGKEAIYKLSPTALNNSTKYQFAAEYADGTRVYYRPEKYTDEGYKSTNISGSEIDSKLTVVEKNNQGGFWILDGSDFSNSTVTIMWNNGEPQLTVTPVGTPEAVKVFFIDRANWGSIHCYAYSDIGLAPVDDSWEGVEASVKNGSWPGVAMTVCQDQNLREGLGLNDSSVTIYEITLNVRKYDDGNYNMPKVIFNNNSSSKQTANLYLVDGGVYANAGSGSPMTEYLPRMQYSYDAENISDREVTAYDDTKYNEIYVDDPKFIEYVKAGNTIAVSLQYDRDHNGEMDYEALGIPGKHTLTLTNIGGKDLLKLSVAEFIVPDNSIVNLSFWPTNQYKENNNNNNFVSEFAGTGHNDDGEHCTSCDMNGNHYDGNHFTCVNSLCSLNFTNVKFADGNVYRRYLDSNNQPQEPVTTIRSLVEPNAIYLVPANIGPFAASLNYEAYDPNGLTYSDLGSRKAYKLKLTDNREPGKLIYLLPEVTPSVSFYLYAELKDGTYVKLSGENKISMTPNTPYDFYTGYSNDYLINIKGYELAKNFQIRISWTDGDVTAIANKNDASFKFVEVDGDTETSRYNYSLMLPAHRDDCAENHLTKIYFTYASGYDADIQNGGTVDLGTVNDSRLANLVVSFTRDPEYEQYFPAFTNNKKAHIVQRTTVLDTDIAVLKNNIAIERLSTSGKPGLAYILVKGYTASVGTLKIAQTISDDNFKRSDIEIPIRIYPTIEGVGLVINDMAVQGDGNGNYSVRIAAGNHNDGNVEFRDRLQFESTSADYKINGKSVIFYHWDVDTDADTPEAKKNTVKRAATLVANPNKSQLIENAKEEQFDNTDSEGNERDLKQYSIYNAPTVDKSSGTTKNVYLQLEQNGMKSPVYTVNVTRDDALTEVDEILGADNDAEIVYYNLNGVKVNADRLEPGIYVKVQGQKSEKIFIR